VNTPCRNQGGEGPLCRTCVCSSGLIQIKSWSVSGLSAACKGTEAVEAHLCRCPHAEQHQRRLVLAAALVQHSLALTQPAFSEARGPRLSAPSRTVALTLLALSPCTGQYSQSINMVNQSISQHGQSASNPKSLTLLALGPCTAWPFSSARCPSTSTPRVTMCTCGDCAQGVSWLSVPLGARVVAETEQAGHKPVWRSKGLGPASPALCHLRAGITSGVGGQAQAGGVLAASDADAPHACRPGRQALRRSAAPQPPPTLLAAKHAVRGASPVIMTSWWLELRSCASAGSDSSFRGHCVLNCRVQLIVIGFNPRPASGWACAAAPARAPTPPSGGTAG